MTVELAESTLDLAQQNLKGYQTVDLSEIRYRSGAISQDEYLKIKIQLLQFQNDVAKADATQDLTVSANYSHVNGINAATFYMSIPLAIFNRNQGEIARTRFAMTQAQESAKQSNNQVVTDVHDAYYNVQTNDQIVQLYLGGYLAGAHADGDIAEYSYH